MQTNKEADLHMPVLRGRQALRWSYLGSDCAGGETRRLDGKESLRLASRNEAHLSPLRWNAGFFKLPCWLCADLKCNLLVTKSHGMNTFGALFCCCCTWNVSRLLQGFDDRSPQKKVAHL